jgi:hypothetical protein
VPLKVADIIVSDPTNFRGTTCVSRKVLGLFHLSPAAITLGIYRQVLAELSNVYLDEAMHQDRLITPLSTTKNDRSE